MNSLFLCGIGGGVSGISTSALAATGETHMGPVLLWLLTPLLLGICCLLTAILFEAAHHAGRSMVRRLGRAQRRQRDLQELYKGFPLAAPEGEA